MQTLSVPLTTAARKPLAWALCVVSSSKQEETLPHQRGWAARDGPAQGLAVAVGWFLRGGCIRQGRPP